MCFNFNNTIFKGDRAMSLGRIIRRFFIFHKATYLVVCFFCMGGNVVFTALSSITPSPVNKNITDWTVLVYVQARNNLSSFSHKNFKDMSTIGSNKKLNLLVQWYKPEDQGLWRYKIDKNQLTLDTYIATPTDGNAAEDLVSAMSWAAGKYPAKKYCLILWNHGVGILDPVWGSGAIQVGKAHFGNNPRIQIAGITTEIEDFSEMIHRGILFNEQSKTYMNNQVLSTALGKIKDDVLSGRKIDIVGMDACLMGMVEVAYQIKDSADFMVTSQEVELAYGWNYLGWLPDLTIKTLAPSQVATSIVQAYESLYKSKIPFYTQSAVDLNKITKLKNIVDLVAINSMTCYAADNVIFPEVVRRARQSCQQFSSANYVDLHSFMKEFQKELRVTYKTDKTFKRKRDINNTITILQDSLEVAVKGLEDTIIANVVGRNLSQARGLSIYFPRYVIEKSYEKTMFALEGAWHDFLKHVLINRSHYVNLLGE